MGEQPVPSAPQYMPTSSPARDYCFPWTNDWFTKDCEPTAAATPGTSWDDSAAAVNLFVEHNRMHDFAYYLGFTEQNWNAQDSTSASTEKWQENDALVGDSQSGAPDDHARQRQHDHVPRRSASSVTNMYFWQPIAASFYAPCVDGDYDMSIIGHEYTHMIENRMIGKGNARSGFHAGAMGESSATWSRPSTWTRTATCRPTTRSRYATGAYATGNKVHGHPRLRARRRHGRRRAGAEQAVC